MTPREELKKSLAHYAGGSRNGGWTKMPGFKFAAYNKAYYLTITGRTEALLKLPDEELEILWAKWRLEGEDTK